MSFLCRLKSPLKSEQHLCIFEYFNWTIKIPINFYQIIWTVVAAFLCIYSGVYLTFTTAEKKFGKPSNSICTYVHTTEQNYCNKVIFAACLLLNELLYILVFFFFDDRS